jgi:hypothetical protein
MAEMKTRPTSRSVTDFINGIEDPRRRGECRTVMKIMREVTGKRPKMWGPSIVGYGRHHYRYESGREGEWFLAGFSPRKQALTLYIMSGFRKHPDLMKRLGKYKTGSSCLYIKSLEDVDVKVLKQLVRESAKYVEKASVR